VEKGLVGEKEGAAANVVKEGKAREGGGSAIE